MEKTYWYFTFEIMETGQGKIVSKSKSVIESNTKFFPKIKAEHVAHGFANPNFDKNKQVPFITNQFEISEADYLASK